MIVTTYSIRCDKCDAYYGCDSESVGYLEKRAKAIGWVVVTITEEMPWSLNGKMVKKESYKHYCPKCKLTKG